MRKEITVAFFGETIYPAPNIRWINYISSLPNIKAIVFTPDDDSSHISDKVTVYKLFGLYPVFRLSKRKELTAKFEAILKKHKVDVLHFLWGVDLPMWINSLDYPSMITTRGSDMLRMLPRRLAMKFSFSKGWLGNYLMLRLHRKAYLKAKAITSTSIKQQNKVKELVPNVKAEALHLIRSGVLIHEFMHETLPKMDKENLVVFSPRTMKPLYNQDIILNAFNTLLKDYPNATLRMINNHPNSDYGKQLKDQVAKLGIDKNVVLLPSQSTEGMHQEYVKSDVVVMIPTTDGTPVSALEGMLALRPVIVGDYDYDKDLFGDDFVWALPDISESALVKMLKNIITTPSEQLTEKISKAQKNAINLTDRKKEMERIVSLYYTIMEE
ncbi:MAG: glycosyltransferase family 4 protein [Aureispira sp.]|nr:glycosyltransferase family 4 protein [Aureispira sp.]